MSSKFFGNSKLKDQPNKNQKNKFKSGLKGKATTAVRKTGRGSWYNQLITLFQENSIYNRRVCIFIFQII